MAGVERDGAEEGMGGGGSRGIEERPLGEGNKGTLSPTPLFNFPYHAFLDRRE